ncbi:DUF3107 domain-containing protein [Nocardioides jiangxiensis]|uniref:DUF3107 domain-containing protein n=1 Tax=Nocardioides jiangxiensis TaxID=3064524 RepID=A0ABT9AXY6_9ACTN|nr:DUF3107 domain-containing protein [Nocardioides sp. WY-20]MDO7867439.1 DUF3107 domain-containing protein [Nocardioides sp. WY-20]
MEVKIGIQNVVRELVVETNETAAAVEKLVSDAIADGGVLALTDGKGRRVVVPVASLAYVDFGGGVQGHVGFRS